MVSLIIISAMVVVVLGDDDSSKRFKLDDLPVLKKWEIPNHFNSKQVGRKFKDLDNLSNKRSYHWELRPDFTSNELDLDEDPEKIKLDFNYKNFIADDSDSDEFNKETKKSDIKLNMIQDNSSNKLKKLKKEKKKSKKKIKKIERKNDGFDNINIIMKYNISNNSNNHPNIQLTNAGNLNKDIAPAINGKNSTKILLKIKKHMKGKSKQDIFFQVENENQDERLVDEILQDDTMTRQKRDVVLDFLQNVRRYSLKHSEHRDWRFKRSYPPNLKIYSPNFKNNKKVLNKLQKDDQLRSIKKRDLTKKSGVLGDEIIDKKNHEKNIMRVDERRQKIDHPVKEKSNLDLVPTNVARAVAMAMEQLKRDKMWGKVFVHVRPSGQLKVMVQETKKMEDQI